MDSATNNSSCSHLNPFDDSISEIQDADIGSEEVFGMSGGQLQAVLDKENKLTITQSFTSGNSFSTSSSLPSMQSASEVGDTYILEKLGVSQYLALKSEPLGKLGSPLSPTKRPWFGNSIQSPKRDPPEESVKADKSHESSGIGEFNPEPSWLKNQSLSLLSESEQFEIPVESKENSQEWLIGLSRESAENPRKDSQERNPRNSNLTYSKDLLEPSDNLMGNCSTDPYVPVANAKDRPPENVSPSLEASAKSGQLISFGHESSVKEKSFTSKNSMEKSSSRNESPIPEQNNSISSLTPEQVNSVSSLIPKQINSVSSLIREQVNSASGKPVEIENYSTSSSLSAKSENLNNEPSLKSSSLLTEKRSLVSNNSGLSRTSDVSRQANRDEPVIEAAEKHPEEISELPSLYWRADASVEPSLPPEVLATEPEACSYVTGNVEPGLGGSGNFCRSVSPSSQSDASTVRMNPSQFCFGSILTEPQLSSTREISDDNDSSPEEVPFTTAEPEKTKPCSPDPANGLGIDSIIALFANTTSLSTPCLMDKVKSYLMERQKVENPFKDKPDNGEISSGLGESHFGGESSSCSSEASEPSTPKAVNRKPATVRHFLLSRHASLPVHSTPLAQAQKLRPPVRASTIEETEEFAHVTATVMKKKKTGNQGQSSPNLPTVKCNKSSIFFGGVSLSSGASLTENLTLRNSSFDKPLDLELRLDENSPFKIAVNSGSKLDLFSKCSERFDPRQEKIINLVFRPNFAATFSTKLNLYPKGDHSKKIKYSVELSGYGGESRIGLCPASETDTIYSQINGTNLTCSFTLQNYGTAAGFALITPVNVNGSPLKCSRCIILPECFAVNPKDSVKVQVLVDFNSEAEASHFKLLVTCGDEILRQRWTKAIMNGVKWKNPSGPELTKLAQLGTGTVSASAVSEHDVGNFQNRLKTQEIFVHFETASEDSDFITLNPESTGASLLHSQLMEKTNENLDTILSQKRLTETIRQKEKLSDKNGRVCLETNEIVFPATKVGAVSTQKIPLQNWSHLTQEIRITKITGPFSVRHLRSAIPAGFYTRLPILFHPAKPGLHSGTVSLEAGNQNILLTVKVRGEAV